MGHERNGIMARDCSTCRMGAVRCANLICDQCFAGGENHIRWQLHPDFAEFTVEIATKEEQVFNRVGRFITIVAGDINHAEAIAGKFCEPGEDVVWITQEEEDAQVI